MKKMIMSMTAQTSIHAGAGQALSTIDLPIQREGHTQYPVIFGSSLKGALRYRAEQEMAKDDEGKSKTLLSVFGPDTKGAESNAHAGAIMVSDAKLLLLPVRSLNGYFKWVTCPALLTRYINDCQRAEIDTDGLEVTAFHTLDKETVAVVNKTDDTLFLEEFALNAEIENSLTQWIERLSADTNISKEDLTEQLAVVSNNMFSYLAQNATPVNAHIALDENKVTIGGALWYEETLPAETVMYSLIMCTDSRSKQKMSAEDVAKVLTGEVLPTTNRYLQVGGNETVGMGWFKVKFLTDNKGAE
ncbi:MAG: type III-B CRISPR module RAMP protein Cmr4 [Moraxellaceae bacterium]|nr:type III-B CRISPR module RAMP protein Cmr4 [Moraxellaceae bacterium]